MKTLLNCCIKRFGGNQRSGKTLSMVNDGYNILLRIKELIYIMERKRLTLLEKERLKMFKDFELWSNLDLNRNIFGNYKQLTIKDIVEIYVNKTPIVNKIILIDDIFKEIDNRDTMKKTELPSGEKVLLSTILSHFCLEIGKSGNILDYVSHYDGMIEKRLNPATEFFIYCSKGHYKTLNCGSFKINNIWIEDVNYYDITTDKNWNESIIIKQNICKKAVDFNDKMEVKRNIYEVDYIEGKKYFNMYKTKEVI